MKTIEAIRNIQQVAPGFETESLAVLLIACEKLPEREVVHKKNLRVILYSDLAKQHPKWNEIIEVV